MTDYIRCNELIDFIADYLSDELPAHERSEFDRHLAVCPACQVYLKTYRETIRISRAAEKVASGDRDLAAPIPDDLVRAILQAKAS